MGQPAARAGRGGLRFDRAPHVVHRHHDFAGVPLETDLDLGAVVGREPSAKSLGAQLLDGEPEAAGFHWAQPERHAQALDRRTRGGHGIQTVRPDPENLASATRSLRHGHPPSVKYA